MSKEIKRHAPESCLKLYKNSAFKAESNHQMFKINNALLGELERHKLKVHRANHKISLFKKGFLKKDGSSKSKKLEALTNRLQQNRMKTTIETLRKEISENKASHQLTVDTLKNDINVKANRIALLENACKTEFTMASARSQIISNLEVKVKELQDEKKLILKDMERIKKQHSEETSLTNVSLKEKILRIEELMSQQCGKSTQQKTTVARSIIINDLEIEILKLKNEKEQILKESETKLKLSYQIYRKKLNEKISSHFTQIKELETKLKTSHTEIEHTKQESVKELEDTKQAYALVLKKFKADVSDLMAKVQAFKSETERMKTPQAEEIALKDVSIKRKSIRIEKLQKELSDKSVEIETLAANNSRITKELEADVTVLKKENGELLKEAERMKTDHFVEINQMKSLRLNLEETQKKVAENQKEIETLTARIHMQDDEMAALKQEKDQLLYEIEYLKKVHAKETSLKNASLSEMSLQVEQLQNKLAETESMHQLTVDTLTNDINVKENRISLLENAYHTEFTLTMARSQIINNFEVKVMELKNEKEQFLKEMKYMEKVHSEEISQNKILIREKCEQIVELQNELSKMEQVQTEIEELQSELAGKSIELEAMKVQILGLQNLEFQIVLLNKEIEQNLNEMVSMKKVHCEEIASMNTLVKEQCAKIEHFQKLVSDKTNELRAKNFSVYLLENEIAELNNAHSNEKEKLASMNKIESRNYIHKMKTRYSEHLKKYKKEINQLKA